MNWVLIFGNLGAPAMGVKGAAIATELEKLDLNGITPMDSMNILFRLKEKL